MNLEGCKPLSCCSNVNRLAFFTTDAGYLVPTLVAANQVAAQASLRNEAHVAVFLVNMEEQVRDDLSHAFPRLQFHMLSAQAFALPAGSTFNKTHVPESALARLIVGELISPQYHHVVYFDGDIQIVGDIGPLLRFEVPSGFLLAAPDIAEIIAPEIGGFARGFRRYLRNLKVQDAAQYFNSGVLAATRETWATMGRAAFDFMSENSDICRFHDQSALNRVFHGRRIALAPRFNFNSWYQSLLPDEAPHAAILHFTGGEKPWSSRAASPISRFREPYLQLVEEFPVLEPFWSRTSGRNELSDRPKLKLVSRLLAAWRSRMRMRRVRAFLSRERFQPSDEQGL